MSRADSHEVGGEGKEETGSSVEEAGGEGTRASHENGGGSSVVRFSMRVML